MEEILRDYVYVGFFIGVVVALTNSRAKKDPVPYIFGMMWIWPYLFWLLIFDREELRKLFMCLALVFSVGVVCAQDSVGTGVMTEKGLVSLGEFSEGYLVGEYSRGVSGYCMVSLNYGNGLVLANYVGGPFKTAYGLCLLIDDEEYGLENDCEIYNGGEWFSAQIFVKDEREFECVLDAIYRFDVYRFDGIYIEPKKF